LYRDLAQATVVVASDAKIVALDSEPYVPPPIGSFPFLTRSAQEFTTYTANARTQSIENNIQALKFLIKVRLGCS
jgi:hypothetical protein